MEFNASNAQISSVGGDVFSHNVVHVTMQTPPEARKIDLTRLKLTPLPSNNFVGREDALDAIKSYIFQNEDRLAVFVLYGLGGAGKTQIAFKFIYTYHNQDSSTSPRLSYVFYVDATSTKTLNASFKEIAASTFIGQDKNDVLSWLASHKESWIIFFDNADDPSLNLRSYFPRCNHGKILITTRNHRARQYYTDRRPLSSFEVGSLPPDIAKALLQRAAVLEDPSNQGEDESNLVEELGYLALAITQAGAAIYQLKLTRGEYLAMFKARRTKLLQELEVDPRALDDYPKSISTTWLMSYEELSPRASHLLDLCAFLHHRGITENIFRNAAQHLEGYKETYPPTDVNSATYQAVEGFLSTFLSAEEDRLKSGKDVWDTLRFRSAIEELCSFSLLSVHDGRTYSMHPLVHDWAQDFCNQQYAQRRLEAELLLACAGQGKYHAEDIAFRRQLLPHVDAISKNQTIESLLSLGVADEYAVVYMEASRWKDAEQLRAEIVQRNLRIFGEDHSTTLKSMGNLASVYRQQDRFQEAKDLELKVLEKFSEIYGEDHWVTLRAMANLAGTYQSLCMFKEAEALEVRVLDGLRRKYGDEHEDTIRAIANLSSTMCYLGRWDEAERLQVDVLKKRRQLLGDTHPDTIRCMGYLSTTYLSQGRLVDAEKLQAEALQKRMATMGKDHEETISGMYALASLYRKMGRPDDAISLGKQVVEIRYRILGEDHPQSLQVVNLLAKAYESQGRSAEALSLCQRNLEILERNTQYGVNTAKLEDVLEDLADTLSRLKQYSQAETIQRQLLEYQKRRLGGRHQYTIVTTGRLALSLQSQSKWDEMERLIVDTLDKLGDESEFGEDQSLLLSMESFLVWAWVSQGRMQEGEELQLKIVEDYTRIFGEKNPASIKAIRELEQIRAWRERRSPSPIKDHKERSEKRSSFSRLTSIFPNLHRHKP